MGANHHQHSGLAGSEMIRRGIQRSLQK